MANLGSLAESGVIALAVSEAAGAVVEPALEPARQEAEKATKARIHDLEQLAASVAQALLTVDDVTDHAARNGYDKDELALSVQLALKAPGVPEAIGLYRRRRFDGIDDATALARLHHALAKAQIEYQYWPQIVQTATVPMTPQVAALAAVRGLIDPEGLLPVNPSTEPGKVPAFPVYPLSGLEAAQAAGMTHDEYGVLVGINGRPMSLHEAASAYFRGIIELADYHRAVSEGDTRNEWRDAILEQARQILTAHDGAELRLRGVTDQSGARAIAALHGMSDTDADLLYEMLGRGLAVHQITTGLARGGTYQGDTSQIPPEYLDELHRSSLRPEYFNLAYANRYSYPSLFQLNALVKANAITADDAKDWATKDGYAPEVVAALHTFWQGEQATSGSGGTVKPKSFTYSQIHQAWRHGVLGIGPTNDQIALSELETIGYSPEQAQTLLRTWQATPASTSTA